MSAGATLAVDLGGSKILACLVEGGRVIEQRIAPTPRDAAADAWVRTIVETAAGWPARFARAAIAVTGIVDAGRWSALNPGILAVPEGFPLETRLREALRVPVMALNDAQGAAWGEYRFGAGRGTESMVFLTVSTGLGGGVVLDRRLVTGRSGAAGSFGQIGASAGTRLEDTLSGQWIANEAARQGHAADAAGVANAARQGEGWADAIIETSAARLAVVLTDMQLLFDPDLFVVGGGVGLSAGYLERVERAIGALSPRLRPHVAAADLGVQAGVIGVADLAAGVLATDSKTEEVG